MAQRIVGVWVTIVFCFGPLHGGSVGSRKACEFTVLAVTQLFTITDVCLFDNDIKSNFTGIFLSIVDKTFLCCHVFCFQCFVSLCVLYICFTCILYCHVAFLVL